MMTIVEELRKMTEEGLEKKKIEGLKKLETYFNETMAPAMKRRAELGYNTYRIGFTKSDYFPSSIQNITNIFSNFFKEKGFIIGDVGNGATSIELFLQW